MHILLIKPRALYILTRFAEACRRLGYDLTVLTASRPPNKHYLTSFIDDTLENVSEIPVAADDVDALAPHLSGYDAVVAGGEFSVILGDKLSAELGLFHNRLDRLDGYRNKHVMRGYFAEEGVRQPRVLAKFSSVEEVESFNWDGVIFPVIVKPVDMSASLYVRFCSDAVSARQIYRRIFKSSQSFSGTVFCAQGLLEEVALGPEYSVECVVQNGRLLMWVPTTKFVSPYPSCDEIGHMSGETFASEALANDVREQVERIVRAWGVTSAIMHVELKVSDDGVKIIEAACRIGGDMISELVELRHGVSLEECLILLRCGQDVTSALNNLSRDGDGYYYGLKYLFSENLDLPVPPEVETLRAVRSTKPDPGPGNGFGVERRLGHRLVRSHSLAAIKNYIGACQSVAASTQDVAVMATIDP